MQLSLAAELAVVSLATGSLVGAGASDDRLVGGVADVHAGTVAGGGDDLPVGEAEDEGALLVAAVELGADTGVAPERLSAFEQLAGDVAEVACGGAGGLSADGLSADGEPEGRHRRCQVEWRWRLAGSTPQRV